MKLKTIYRYCFALLLGFLLTPGEGLAKCSCSPNYPSYDVTAYEFTADSCEPDANGRYYYKMNAVRCSSGSIELFMSYSYLTLSPAEVTNQYSGYNILKNESGTHIMVLVPHYPPLQTLIGSAVPASTGVHDYELLNKYCTHFPLPDQDGDDFPDCLDCNDNDPLQSIDCPPPCTDCAEKDNNLGPPECPVSIR